MLYEKIAPAKSFYLQILEQFIYSHIVIRIDRYPKQFFINKSKCSCEYFIKRAISTDLLNQF